MQNCVDPEMDKSKTSSMSLPPSEEQCYYYTGKGDCSIRVVKLCGVQAFVRGWFARKVATYLRIRVCSAVIIQAQWRCYEQQQRYLSLKRTTVLIQSHWRGYLQRRR